jgi:hypothetical protein
LLLGVFWKSLVKRQQLFSWIHRIWSPDFEDKTSSILFLFTKLFKFFNDSAAGTLENVGIFIKLYCDSIDYGNSAFKNRVPLIQMRQPWEFQNFELLRCGLKMAE